MTIEQSETKSTNNKMSWVTIKESHYESDLLVLKSKLESEGIKCFLKNESTTQVFSHIATFTVELQVPAEDEKRALEIIRAAS